MNTRRSTQNSSAARPSSGTPDAAGGERAAAIRIDRASTELRRGRPLVLRASGLGPGPELQDGAWLVAAVETLSEALLADWLATGRPVRLLLTAERMASLGRAGATRPHTLLLPPGLDLHRLAQWAAVAGEDETADGRPPPRIDPALPTPEHHPAADAAVALAKRARLIPAFIVLERQGPDGPAWTDGPPVELDVADLSAASVAQAQALRRVSAARVPLGAVEDCTLVVFRELDGDAEHLAIVVGQPAAGAPVPVRLHSACLTGDLLDSLRCDCGPQLQRAVQRLGETGGVLLYLAQEGRGTGLANKLRAYRLQDEGLDTLQADRYLGFRDDERQFAAAAFMLKALGYPRIHLMTNNPQKIDALREAGIEVVDRLPLIGPVNAHNQRYLQTKRAAGHLGAD